MILNAATDVLKIIFVPNQYLPVERKLEDASKLINEKIITS